MARLGEANDVEITEPEQFVVAETPTESEPRPELEPETVPSDLESWAMYLSGAGFDSHYDVEDQKLYVFIPAVSGDETDIPADGPIAKFSETVGGVAWSLQVIDGSTVWTAVLGEEEKEHDPADHESTDDEEFHKKRERPEEHEAPEVRTHQSDENDHKEVSGTAPYAEATRRRSYGGRLLVD
jgi:hypothetical protein